jgi:hypothetical protein
LVSKPRPNAPVRDAGFDGIVGWPVLIYADEMSCRFAS